MIRLKLSEYRLEIQNCENRISSLKRSIDSINSMIDTAREEQERTAREAQQ